MRDVFYTLLIVWIISRIFSAFSSVKTQKTNSSSTTQKREGETTIEYTPPKKNNISDDAGEYVDYEEVK